MRNSLRPEIEKIMPITMLARPVDHRGYPVPWFVKKQVGDGRWDFRIVYQKDVFDAFMQKLCWVCGEKLDHREPTAFVMGPMSCINKTTSEPGSHVECARFALRVCPFMVMPQVKRRDAGLEEERLIESDELQEHNPGAMALWVTDLAMAAHGPASMRGVILISVGEPSRLEWWAGGEHRSVYDPLIEGPMQDGVRRLIEIGAEPGRMIMRVQTLIDQTTEPVNSSSCTTQPVQSTEFTPHPPGCGCPWCGNHRPGA